MKEQIETKKENYLEEVKGVLNERTNKDLFIKTKDKADVVQKNLDSLLQELHFEKINSVPNGYFGIKKDENPKVSVNIIFTDVNQESPGEGYKISVGFS